MSVQLVRPISDELTEWSASGGSPTHYTQIDEETPNYSDYIQANLFNRADSMRLAAPAIEEDAVQSVVVRVVAALATVPGAGIVTVYLSDGVWDLITNPGVSKTFTVDSYLNPVAYDKTFDVGPNGAWTWADFANLRVTYYMTSGTRFVRVYQSYATVTGLVLPRLEAESVVRESIAQESLVVPALERASYVTTGLAASGVVPTAVRRPSVVTAGLAKDSFLGGE